MSLAVRSHFSGMEKLTGEAGFALADLPEGDFALDEETAGTAFGVMAAAWTAGFFFGAGAGATGFCMDITAFVSQNVEAKKGIFPDFVQYTCFWSVRQ